MPSDRPNLARVPSTGEGQESGADYNLKILAPMARFFKEAGRHDDLAQICKASQLAVSDFDTPIRWISLPQFEAFHAETRARVASDDEFRDVCAYRMAESYGPLRFFFWATTPVADHRGSRQNDEPA